MKRPGRSAKGTGRGAKATPETALSPATAPDSGPETSPEILGLVAGTNLVIADIVLRAAGSLLNKRMEKGLLVARTGASIGTANPDQPEGKGRAIATSLALWGASRLATRSPLGLAVVAGGLAAKLLYDHGKRLEAKRTARAPSKDATIGGPGITG
jgi:hypothetical protein